MHGMHSDGRDDHHRRPGQQYEIVRLWRFNSERKFAVAYHPISLALHRREHLILRRLDKR
jgi:hypothetical protein